MNAQETALIYRMSIIAEVSIENFMNDWKIDRNQLENLSNIPPFIWLVRKNGTSLCFLEKIESSISILQIGHDWGHNEHPSYYYFDGKKLRQISQTEACQILNIQMEK